MKRYLSLIIAFTAIENDLFAAETGMPQLDPTYWASQAFWLILIFSILYISIAKYYLPKIKNNLDDRENKIKEDLDAANKFKELSELKLKEYERTLENSKKEVSKILLETKTKLDKDIQLKKNNIEKEIENEIAKAQKEAKRQKIDAEGKAVANKILSASLTDKILREKGIEATLELSKSPNSKVIVIGSGKSGMPIILGNQ